MDSGMLAILLSSKEICLGRDKHMSTVLSLFIQRSAPTGPILSLSRFPFLLYFLHRPHFS
jgi:hypothetical protein